MLNIWGGERDEVMGISTEKLSAIKLRAAKKKIEKLLQCNSANPRWLSTGAAARLLVAFAVINQDIGRREVAG